MMIFKFDCYWGRSPHGERGLKYIINNHFVNINKSLSSRRAWIEIKFSLGLYIKLFCRSPHGERGLKFVIKKSTLACAESLSSRRAWIEIRKVKRSTEMKPVALLTESVDWNFPLLKSPIKKSPSLSSRRAWIEIYYGYKVILAWISRSPHGERGLKYRQS